MQYMKYDIHILSYFILIKSIPATLHVMHSKTRFWEGLPQNFLKIILVVSLKFRTISLVFQKLRLISG